MLNIKLHTFTSPINNTKLSVIRKGETPWFCLFEALNAMESKEGIYDAKQRIIDWISDKSELKNPDDCIEIDDCIDESFVIDSKGRSHKTTIVSDRGFMYLMTEYNQKMINEFVYWMEGEVIAKMEFAESLQTP